jgi:low temperature requirement protein LtrA
MYLWEVWSHKTSLTLPLFIEVSVPSQVSEHLFTCVLIVSILLLSTIFLLDFGTVLTSGIVSFSFYWLSNLLILSLPDEGYSEST